MLVRILVAALLVASGTSCSAVDVGADVSTRETYVGEPIVYEIYLNNVVDHDVPEVPEVDGLTIESMGAPSQRSSRSIVIQNGRQRQTVRSTITYRFRVTPNREGTFTIPPVKVVAGSLATITKAVRIVATKSETGDLMFVEVSGDREEVFVGEPLELTLSLWIRPYRNRELRLAFDDREMWSQLSQRTNWGPFTKRMEELAEQRQYPGGRSVLKEVPADSASGTGETVEREFYLYQVTTTIYPDRPGKIDSEGLRMVLSYPVELGRRRGFFDDPFFGSLGGGGRVKVTKSRPIEATASIDSVLVKPIPTADRPNDYRGAVGEYSIITDAKPKRVKAGDPITLHMVIDGDGPMELVRAPDLAVQDSLTKNFKVDDEPLAGIVDGTRKIFATTVRPLHDGVTQIPPITYSYFDPKSGKFVTKQSQPIAIEVEPAEVLAMDAIVGGNRRGGSGKTPNTPSSSSPQRLAGAAAPAFSLYNGPGLLTNSPRPDLLSAIGMPLLWLPPMFALLAVLFGAREQLSWLVGRLVSDRSRLDRALRTAETAPDVAVSLRDFLSARFSQRGQSEASNESAIREFTIGQLRAAGLNELAIRTERVYAQAEKAGLMPMDERGLQELKSDVVSIADDLRSKKGRVLLARHSSWLSTSSVIALAITLAMQGTALAKHELTAQQQTQLLDTATTEFQAASTDAMSPAESQQAFEAAAESFQLVVDSGVTSHPLYFNLASAQWKSGQVGLAVANYRRALRLDPTNEVYGRHLAIAQAGKQPVSRNRAIALAQRANELLLRFVSLRAVIGLLWFTWFSLWITVALRAFRVSFPWKTIAIACLLVLLVTGCSCWLQVAPLIRDDAGILVVSEVSLRSGDGNEFAEASQLTGVEGKAVRVLMSRGDWTQIATDDHVGWVSNDVVERI